MRRLALAILLASVPLIPRAHAQAADGLAPTDQGEAVDAATAELQSQVSELDSRLAEVEARPAVHAAARSNRVERMNSAMELISRIETSVSLGQGDLSGALEDARAQVEALASEQSASANPLEGVRTRAAADALVAALEEIGNSDLYGSRRALEIAYLALNQARDLALAG